MSRCVVGGFMGHRRDVRSGALWACAAFGAGGGTEPARGSAGVWISRKTIQKMLRYAVPPGYERQHPVKRPKLGPWIGVINAMLEDDRRRPVKQRHTAKRIFDRLREEHGFGGGYTIVKDYVRAATLHGQKMFRAVDTCCGRSAGGLRRSPGGGCRRGAEGALPGDGPAPLG